MMTVEPSSLLKKCQTDLWKLLRAGMFFSPSRCSLTAWPLIRDVFFYSLALVVLVIVFLDDLIQWWEALILFLWYIAYVGFMKFNEKVEDGLRKLFGLEAVVSDQNKGYKRKRKSA